MNKHPKPYSKAPVKYDPSVVPALFPEFEALLSHLRGGKDISYGLIASNILAVISLVCLSLIEVLNPSSGISEPVALNLLVIASSGAGKSTIYNQLTAEIHSFIAEMKADYQERKAESRIELKVWKLKEARLEKNLAQAIDRGFGSEIQDLEYKNHLKKEPRKPRRFNLVYKDVTHAALMEGLAEFQYGGLMVDEAETFFSSILKKHFGFLNTVWDGGPYEHRRAGREPLDLFPVMMCLLMAQPGVFYEFIEKNQTAMKDSGYMGRFLPVMGERHKLDDLVKRLTSGCTSLDQFHRRIREILDEAKERFDNGDQQKTQFTLNFFAAHYLGQKEVEIMRHAEPGGKWEHIKEFCLKACSNAIRIAALLHFFEKKAGTEISSESIKAACTIMDWYLEQASMIFFKQSNLYIFQKRCADRFTHIHHELIKADWLPIRSKDQLNRGPKDSQSADAIKPVLRQLVIQERITLLRCRRTKSVYIVAPHHKHSYLDSWEVFPRNEPFPAGCDEITYNDSQGDYYELDLPSYE
ncbi:YfjI family protein [Dryocola sp. LX212]